MLDFKNRPKEWGRADSGLPAGSRPAWRFTSSPHASQAAPPQRCCIFGDPGWLAPPPIKKAPFFMELFCPFFIGGGRTPGFPPVRALHGASLRVRTRAKQLARSAPNKKSSIFYGAFLSFFYWGRADSNRRNPKVRDLQSLAIAAMRHPQNRIDREVYQKIDFRLNQIMKCKDLVAYIFKEALICQLIF